MPLLEYICKSGHRFEVLLKFSSIDKTPRCPVCHKAAEWAPTQAQKPILKAGVGGFYSPTKP